MSIKSEVTVHEAVPEKPYYPRVMVNIREGQEGCKGVVVLFTSKNTGVALNHGPEGSSAFLGVSTNTWIDCTSKDDWQPCTITLTTET